MEYEFGGTTRTIMYDNTTEKFILYDDFEETKQVNPYEFVLPQYIELIRIKAKNIFTHDLDGEPITLWVRDF